MVESLFAFALVLGGPARADRLEDIRKNGKIVWTADQEGGGPYVFPREDDPTKVTGFEYDLAGKIAEYMKVQPEFQQGQWDKLLDYVGHDKADIVINGYEWMPERVEGYEASLPYYVYALQLLASKEDKVVGSWDDVTKPKADGEKVVVGVLSGSGAEEYMVELCKEGEEENARCEVVPYEGNTDSMREVETGKIDATLQDTPIASFYAPRFAELQFVGDPVGPGYYVIYAKKGERSLIDAVNEAIIVMSRNGDLESTYRTYGIWDKQQAELLSIAETGKFFGFMKAVVTDVQRAEMPTQEEVQLSVRKHGLEVVKEYGGTLLGSAAMTVVLSLLSFPIAISAGLCIAVGRLYGPTWLRVPLATYVEFIRGTPLMVQLYFIFFFLPEVGVNVPAFATAVIGLAINYSAYESEIYRAGLQAIPPGQMEAALSLGMSQTQGIFRVVVPQAFRIVIPPVINDFIALFKDTSVCSVVTIIELTKRFSILSMSTQATIEMMAMTCLLYMLMSYPTALLSRHVEKKLGLEAKP